MRRGFSGNFWEINVLAAMKEFLETAYLTLNTKKKKKKDNEGLVAAIKWHGHTLGLNGNKLRT